MKTPNTKHTPINQIPRPNPRALPHRSAWLALVVWCVAPGVVSLLAQEDTNAPTRMKPTVVTGSYIPTAETVGPVPVESVSAADIAKVGEQDALHGLRGLGLLVHWQCQCRPGG